VCLAIDQHAQLVYIELSASDGAPCLAQRAQLQHAQLQPSAGFITSNQQQRRYGQQKQDSAYSNPTYLNSASSSLLSDRHPDDCHPESPMMERQRFCVPE
jgi:hypothetical protein